MIIKTANFWDEPGDAHVITTNGSLKTSGECVMGRGIALQARNRFPGLAKHLGNSITQYGNKVIYLGSWESALRRTYHIYSFPVKHHWYEKADLDLIVTSAAQLVLQCSGHNKVVMVRPGCGNGGLKWKDVMPRIQHYFLDNKFVVVDTREIKP